MHNVGDGYAIIKPVFFYAGLKMLTFTICISGSFSSLTVSGPSDFLEGQACTVTCTASYTCAIDVPTLTWNYGSMPASTITQNIRTTEWRTTSTLTFTAAATDHGRSLTCYARFSGQTQDRSITLRVKSE